MDADTDSDADANAAADATALPGLRPGELKMIGWRGGDGGAVVILLWSQFLTKGHFTSRWGRGL